MEDLIANKIRLKPRFSLQVKNESGAVQLAFVDFFSTSPQHYRVKVVDNHIVIDVPLGDEHLWSPQLQLELEANNGGTRIKGLFGPKPQLWTFFMMIHFAMAITFAVFAVLAYSQFTLDKNYTLSSIICTSILILWILFYVLGQFGKKKGHDQMAAMHDFVMDIVGD